MEKVGLKLELLGGQWDYLATVQKWYLNIPKTLFNLNFNFDRFGVVSKFVDLEELLHFFLLFINKSEIKMKISEFFEVSFKKSRSLESIEH